LSGGKNASAIHVGGCVNVDSNSTLLVTLDRSSLDSSKKVQVVSIFEGLDNKECPGMGFASIRPVFTDPACQANQQTVQPAVQFGRLLLFFEVTGECAFLSAAPQAAYGTALAFSSLFFFLLHLLTSHW